MTQPTKSVTQVGNRTFTDRSGTITGTTQVVMAANPLRDGFLKRPLSWTWDNTLGRPLPVRTLPGQ